MVLRDDAGRYGIDDGARDSCLRGTKHLNRLLRALDRDLVEQDRVGLRRKVRRDYGQQRGEAVLVVRQRVRERLARVSRFGTDDQIDVRDFVTIAHEGFAQREISCHDHYLRTGEKGLLRTPSREDSLKFIGSRRPVQSCALVGMRMRSGGP